MQKNPISEIANVQSELNSQIANKENILSNGSHTYVDSLDNYLGENKIVCAGPSTIGAPNTTNAAWCVASFSIENGFALQLAIGYSPSEVYARRCWGGGWSGWEKLN